MVQADGRSLPRVTLTATVSDKVEPPVDETTCRIVPRDGVERLVEATVEGQRVPILLARDRTFWLNTYTPSNACWDALLPRLVKARLHHGVVFGSFAHSVGPDGVTSTIDEGVTTIGDEP